MHDASLHFRVELAWTSPLGPLPRYLGQLPPPIPSKKLQFLSPHPLPALIPPESSRTNSERPTHSPGALLHPACGWCEWRCRQDMAQKRLEKPQRAGSLQVCVWAWRHASHSLKGSLKLRDSAIPASHGAAFTV